MDSLELSSHTAPDGGPRIPPGLLDGFVAHEVARGTLFATPDDPRDQVLIVGEGRLRVYLAGENRELSLSYLEAGDIYTTHTPTYLEAVTPCTLWLMDTRAFARKLTSDPAVTPAMMRVLGRLLANAVHLIEDLAFRDVPARLARFLCGLAERRGRPLDGGIWLVPLELGTEDIASLLGSTRQTVSSLLTQWERDGILRRQGRRVLFIHALDSLRRLGASA